MTPDQWRALGYRVEKQKLVRSRGIVFRIFFGERSIGTVYRYSEISDLIDTDWKLQTELKTTKGGLQHGN